MRLLAEWRLRRVWSCGRRALARGQLLIRQRSDRDRRATARTRPIESFPLLVDHMLPSAPRDPERADDARIRVAGHRPRRRDPADRVATAVDRIEVEVGEPQVAVRSDCDPGRVLEPRRRTIARRSRNGSRRRLCVNARRSGSAGLRGGRAGKGSGFGRFLRHGVPSPRSLRGPGRRRRGRAGWRQTAAGTGRVGAARQQGGAHRPADRHRLGRRSARRARSARCGSTCSVSARRSSRERRPTRTRCCAPARRATSWTSTSNRSMPRGSSAWSPTCASELRARRPGPRRNGPRRGARVVARAGLGRVRRPGVRANRGRARLDELHAVALEARAETGLSAGRHAETDRRPGGDRRATRATRTTARAAHGRPLSQRAPDGRLARVSSVSTAPRRRSRA